MAIIFKNAKQVFTSQHPSTKLNCAFDNNPKIDLPTEKLIELDKDLFANTSHSSIDEILRQLNQKPNDYITKLKELAGVYKQISWDDALKIFADGKISGYKNLNPTLSDEQIIKIDALMADFLAQNHIEGKRVYGMEVGTKLVRTFLCFEYCSQLLLRKNQVESVIELIKSEDKNIVTQQGTGSGKSKVQFPLLQRLLKGVFNLWPSALFPTNRDDIMQSAADNFRQKAEAFTCHRNDPKDHLSLKQISYTLHQALKEEKQISSRAEDIQSLELALIELLYNFTKHPQNVDEKSFYVLQEMLTLIRKTKSLIDESHVVQNPKKELNYSLGEPVAEPTELVQFMAKIFYALTSKEIDDLLKLTSNEQHAVAEENFAKATHLLADKMIKELEIDFQNQAEFKEYLVNESVGAPDWLNSHPQRDQIALLRGSITSLIHDCFYRKAIGTNYGCQDPTKLDGFAIPYTANNTPVPNSEYDITWETLLKTFHIYSHSNLSDTQTFELIKLLQQEAENESYSLREPIENTKAYKFIESIRQENRHIKSLTDIELGGESMEILQQNKLFKLEYVTRFVAPKVKRYNEKANSNVQNLRSQFDSMITMTATPIDPEIYAPKPTFFPDENESDKKVEQRLQHIDIAVHIEQAAPKEMLESLIQKISANHKTRMLIDSGAMLKGVTNRLVAEQLLQKSSDTIKGVLFFNEEEEMVVLEKGHSQPVPLKLSALQPDERFTYCDHKHIFGADTKQMDEAIALCTVGHQTTYEELIQGAGRLRKLLEFQEAHFVVTEKMSVEQIIEATKANSSLDREDRLYRAIKQQIHDEVRSRVITKILNCHTVTEAAEIFAKAKRILITSPNADVWQMYGQKSHTVNRAAALTSYLTKMKQIAKSLKIFDKAEIQELNRDIDSYLNKITNCHFQTQVKELSDVSESHSEMQKEMQKENEITVEKQAKKRIIPLLQRPQRDWPQIDIYQEGWIKIDKVGRSILQKIAILLNLLPTYLDKLDQFLKNKLLSKLDIYDEYNKEGTLLWYEGVKFGINMNLFLHLWHITLCHIPLPIMFFGVKKAIAILANKSFKSTVSFYDSSELLSQSTDPDIRKISSYFKPDKNKQILVTSNFMPVKESIGFTPFSDEQKQAFKMLVVKENGKFTAIVGDQTSDQASWHHLINNGVEHNNDNSKIIFEYDLQLNQVTNGADIEIESLNQDLDFQLMLIKVKLLNGDTDFTNYQLKLLSYIVNNKNKATTLSKFLNKVILNHPEKKKKYHMSRLYQNLKNK